MRILIGAGMGALDALNEYFSTLESETKDGIPLERGINDDQCNSRQPATSESQ